MSEVSDLLDHEGVVSIMHVRKVILECDYCHVAKHTDDFDAAEKFIERHTRKCSPSAPEAGRDAK